MHFPNYRIGIFGISSSQQDFNIYLRPSQTSEEYTRRNSIALDSVVLVLHDVWMSGQRMDPNTFFCLEKISQTKTQPTPE